jgi:hypothetical protein
MITSTRTRSGLGSAVVTFDDYGNPMFSGDPIIDSNDEAYLYDVITTQGGGKGEPVLTDDYGNVVTAEQIYQTLVRREAPSPQPTPKGSAPVAPTPGTPTTPVSTTGLVSVWKTGLTSCVVAAQGPAGSSRVYGPTNAQDAADWMSKNCGTTALLTSPWVLGGIGVLALVLVMGSGGRR